jgi:hypothetical protein
MCTIPSLGRVHPKLPMSLPHWVDLLPVCFGFPVGPGPVDPGPDHSSFAVDEWFWHQEQADRHRSETPVFHPEDRIWLSTRNLTLRLPWKKLSPRFVRLFMVLQRVSEVTYMLQLASHYRVSLLRPVVPGSLADTVPWAYTVRSLLDFLCIGGPALVSGGRGVVWPRGEVLGSGGGQSGPSTSSMISTFTARTDPLLGVIHLVRVVLWLEPCVRGWVLSHLLLLLPLRHTTSPEYQPLVLGFIITRTCYS